MTKKIFAMFLAVLMVVSMLPTSVFAAGTCPYKGTGLHTAKNCNNTVIGEPVAATCNTPGFTAYKCNDCGDEFHDNVVPATGAHTYVDAPDKAPTCEEDGKQGLKVCSGCGDEKAATTIPCLSGKDADGNPKYNCQWEITNPQINCLTGGEQVWTCVTCGAEKTVTVKKVNSHDWDEFEIVTEATKDVPGLAVRVCKDCGAEDKVAVYYDHECENNLIDVEAIEMTCTTNGLKVHKECRICGTKYNEAGTEKLSDTKIAELTVVAGHTYECPSSCPLKNSDHKLDSCPAGCTVVGEHTHTKHVATCVDTVLHCQKCDQTLAPEVEHTYSTTAEVSKPATCTASGWKTFRCTSCSLAVKTEIVPKLGHKTVEVTVPATCVSIGYTFTYCTRFGCTENLGEVGSKNDKDGNTYSVQVEGYSPITTLPTFEKAEDRVLGGFYLALSQTAAETELFFTGKMDGNFLAASNNVAEAVLVYLERVHVGLNNQYYLFFYNAEGVKTYIDLTPYEKTSNSGSKYAAAGVKLTTETPKAIFTWNDTHKVLLSVEMVYNAAGAKDQFFLGTYNNFETISASSDYYLGSSSQYMAKLCTVGEAALENVKLTSIVFNYDAGKNTSNHGANLETVTKVAAECDVDGSGEYRCSACGWGQAFVIPAGHTYEAVDYTTTPKFNQEDTYKAPTCVAGYIYEACTNEGCDAFVKTVLAGYGHVMGTEQTPTLTHENPRDYKHTDCTISGCTHSVKGEYVVWEGVDKVYSSYTDAAAAHTTVNKKLTSQFTEIVKGDCFTARRTQWKCECGMWVVVEEIGYGYGKHKDMVTLGQYRDPDCVNDGGFYTFLCSGCEKLVGDAPHAAQNPTTANWNTISKLGHDFKVPTGHECNDCGNPDITKVHSTCQRTGCTETVKCFKDLTGEYVTSGEDLCDKGSYEYYWCEKCQAMHFRSVVMPMGHDYQPTIVDGKIVYNTNKAPTCKDPGEYTVTCTICGDTDTRIAPTTAHKNAAGQEFYNNCQDKVEDRHCKLCCTCTNKGTAHDCTKFDTNSEVAGVQPCACVIKADHQYVTKEMSSNCSMPPYLAKSCPDCGHRTNEVLTKVTTANGEKEVKFIGHMPAEIDKIAKLNAQNEVIPGEFVEVKLPGYVYESFTYYIYTFDAATNVWVETPKTYTAKFIERKAASYTEEGYDHFFCQICKSEEKNMKAKLTGLGFEFDVKNVLGGTEFTYGSLIEVTVFVNGNNADVHGFNFNVSVNETLMPIDAGAAVKGAKFVGYEKLNDDFNLIVTNPSKTAANAKVSGFAANTASGKQQNITINGKTELVKLYFRIADKAFVAVSSLTAKFEAVQNEPMVTVLKDGESVDVSANTNMLNKDFATRAFLNFNNDTAANTKDLQMAMSMITLEHVDGKTYDVTVDVNKDGVVDLQDLSIAYNYVVGNYDLEELLVMGISDAEVELLDLNEKIECNSKSCDALLDADDTYCWKCGNHQ